MKGIRSDKIITPEGLFDGVVLFENGKIIAVQKNVPEHVDTLDARGKFVSPGFIDIHTHGGGGHPFEGSVADIVEGCRFHLSHGTTTVCPTVSAAPFSDMARSVSNIKDAMKEMPTILGAHLEGPYLSAKQAGAQAPDFLTPPNAEEYLPLLEKHGGAIARWTYAPENDKNGAFARALVAQGVLPSAGHTDALYEDMLIAEASGCRLVTHLYSCTSTVTREMGFRRLGVIESAYLSDDMFVEIICDGKHLPPELIRMIVKIKGCQRVILVTDSLALTGTNLTEGRMQATDFIIEDGVCKLRDRTAFAGSIATADRLLHVAVKEANIPLLDAVRMLTETPANLLGLSDRGKIAASARADIVLFDEDIRVSTVLVNGKLMYKSN